MRTPSRRPLPCSLVVLGLAALAAQPGPARAVEMAWDGAPFAASPAAVRAAADALPPPDAEAEVLLDEVRIKLDARGAVTAVHRQVFRPLLPRAVKTWSHLELTWAPWRQARPKVRARVIAPDGGASYQDPVKLTEAASSGPFAKTLVGEIVGVDPGAVVELEVTEHDEVPLELPGTIRLDLARSAPIRRLVVVAEAPAALPLRAAIRGELLGAAADGTPPPPAPAKGTPAPIPAVKGVRALRLVRTGIPAVAPEASVPVEVAAVPQLTLGWAASWADLSRRAAALWDRDASSPAVAEAARAAFGPASGKAKPGREELVRRATAWLRRTVKATGPDELSAAPLAGDGPAATLRRGSADAREAAALLAALLRRAGLPAELALVGSGPDEVDPRVPGMDFDRLVVRVAGAPELWVDPATPLLAPGRLAAPVERRLALPLGRGAAALVRTPASGAGQNRVRIVRELHLAQLGRGTILETRELTGGPAGTERAARAAVPPEARDDVEQRYAHAYLQGDDVTYAEVEGQDDPAAPLRIRMEVRGSDAVRTDDDGARISISADPAFELLPAALLQISPEEPRRSPLAVAYPFQAELVYLVIPPDGFRVQAIPAPLDQAFGPVRFTQRYAVDPRGVATATLRVECPVARLSPAEAQAVADGLRALSRQPAPTVRVERIASALLAAGQVREGLAELDRLGRVDLSDPVPPGQQALALLRVGLQPQAVEAGLTSLRRDPRRAWPSRVLGFVLEHDAVGRFHGPGFDRENALLYYRRARSLDPRSAETRAQLAQLLARDAQGRLLPPPQLAEAIAEYASIARELGDKHAEGARLDLLVAARRWAEVEPLARELPEGEDRDAALVAAVAVLQGAAEAEEEARALGEAGKDALSRASFLLVRERRYPLAAALAKAAARGATEGPRREQADLFARLGPWEVKRSRGEEAERLVLRIASAALAGDRDALLAEVAREGLSPALVDDLAAGLAALVRASAGSGARQGLSRDVVLDVLAAELTVAQVRGPAGLALRVRLGGGPEAALLVAVKSGGALRVAAADVAWPVLFAQAERRAAAGDDAAARALLELGREVVARDRSPDGPAEVLRALWPGPKAGRAELRRAATALTAYGEPDGRTADALEAALRAATAPAERRALGLALAEVYRATSRWPELRRVSGELLAADPRRRRPFELHTLALARLGDAAAVDAAVGAFLAAAPDDPEVLEAAAAARLGAGDLAGASALYRRVVETGLASPGAYNDAAWLELFQDAPDPRALDWAQRANPAGQARHTTLNTLAAVQAASSRPAEARDTFLRSLAARGGGAPEDADWLVQGLIAEACGLPEAARAAYLAVKPDTLDPSAPFILAQRRLAGLAARPPAPAADPAQPDPPSPAAPPARPEKEHKRPGQAQRERGTDV